MTTEMSRLDVQTSAERYREWLHGLRDGDQIEVIEVQLVWLDGTTCGGRKPGVIINAVRGDASGRNGFVTFRYQRHTHGHAYNGHYSLTGGNSYFRIAPVGVSIEYDPSFGYYMGSATNHTEQDQE